MKILLSAYSCNPYKGGEHGNGWNYAYYNCMKGHEVWCFTSIEEKEAIDRYLADQPIRGLHLVYISFPGWLQSWRLDNPNTVIYIHYIFFQWQAYKKAASMLPLVSFDLVHHITYGSLQLGSYMWKLDLPIIFGPVGGGQVAPVKYKSFFGKWWLHEQMRETISFLLLHVLRSTKKLMKRSNIVLVSNEPTRDLALKLRAQDVRFFSDTMLHTSFFPKTIPMRSSKKELQVLWVGRLIARKGLLLVLEAFKRISPNDQIRLTILGDGPIAPLVRDMIAENDMGAYVQWMGRKSFDEVQKAYQRHDAFIYCTLRESLGSQLVEAMAYGLPVITLDHHGAQKFVPESAGCKIAVREPENTLDEVVDSLFRLRDEPEVRLSMGKFGFDYAKKFNAASCVEEMNKMYNEIIHDHQQLEVEEVM